MLTATAALGSHAADGANWTDYADLVLEVGILIAAVIATLMLVRMLRNQREYLDRTFESVTSEIAEHEHRMADRIDAAGH